MRCLAVTFAGLLLSSGSLSAAQPVATYRVHATLTDGARVIGNPVVVLQAGQKTGIKIRGPNGDYRLTLTAAPQADGGILTRWVIDVDSPRNGHRLARPVLTVMPGIQTNFAFGADNATAKPVHVSFVIDRTGG
jgi:hypothetical protein